MMNKLHQMTCGLAAVALLAATAAGEPITDPIPERVPDADVRVELELVAEGLVSPVWGTNAGDGSGRLFIVDQVGKIHVIQNGQLRDEPYLDLTEQIVELQQGFDERGLLGLAFHPDFANQGADGYGKFYTYSSEPLDAHDAADFPLENLPEGIEPNHVGVLSEWQLDDHSAESVSPNDRRVVMTIEQPQFNHNGGATLIGPDGMLYLSLGDGGAGNDLGPGHTPETGNGQDATNVLGSILRIDPLGRDGDKGYAVPDDNPFVGDDERLDEIYAYGLRNAFLMSFDGDTLIAADVGQEHIEEVNVIEAGGNYGWNLKEGTFYFDPTAERGMNILAEPLDHRPVPDDLIDPTVQYDHDEGISIMGGFVYRGSRVEQLEGLYVFGDWQSQVPDSDETSGRLFIADLEDDSLHALPAADDGSYIGPMVTGFAEDEDGEIYVLTSETPSPTGDGQVWKIVPHDD